MAMIAPALLPAPPPAPAPDPLPAPACGPSSVLRAGAFADSTRSCLMGEAGGVSSKSIRLPPETAGPPRDAIAAPTCERLRRRGALSDADDTRARSKVACAASSSTFGMSLSFKKKQRDRKVSWLRMRKSNPGAVLSPPSKVGASYTLKFAKSLLLRLRHAPTAASPEESFPERHPVHGEAQLQRPTACSQHTLKQMLAV